MTAQLAHRLEQQEIVLEITDEAKHGLLKMGMSQLMELVR